jgi:hypothetical protein
MWKVNLAAALGSFEEHRRPRISGELNGRHVKLVKFRVPVEFGTSLS